MRSITAKLILMLLVCGAIGIATPRLSLAEVVLERVFPPAVSCGSQATLRAEGKFPNWPPQVYCDRADISLELLPESGQLLVQTSPQTTPGVAWIRLYDAQGVSAAVPLCLARQEVSVEAEPNASFAEATALPMPAVVSGRLNPGNDVDCFRVRLAPGQRFTATLTAQRVLNSPMDAVLQIVDRKGYVLCQSDDAFGLDPQVSLESTSDQEVMLRLFAFPETPNSTIGFAGGESYVYLLDMHTQIGTDHFLPLIAPQHLASYEAFSRYGPNPAATAKIQALPASEISPTILFEPDSGSWQWLPETFNGAFYLEGQPSNPAALPPCVFSGHVSEPGDSDQFTFEAEQDVTYEILVHSQNYGFPLDSTLRITNAAGAELASNDDLSRRPYDAGLQFKAPESGPYTVNITDLSGDGSWLHAYSMTIEKLVPRCKLSVDRDAFNSRPGQVLEIPVAVVRQHGFNTRMTFRASGLPQAAVLEPAISEPEGASSKALSLKVKLASETPPGNYRFRLEAVDDAQPESVMSCLFSPRPGIQVREFWLTVQE
ncbi:MAG: hypothetical protein NXI32_22345 [bacterium]|nr:hypothetical protein [bacterium]